MVGRVGRLFSAAAVAALAAACGGASGNHIRAIGGDLIVQPPAVDFGDVALGMDANTSLLVRNDGIAPLDVETIGSLNSNAFVVSGLPVRLAPGQSSPVQIHYQPPALGTHTHTISLVTDAPGAKGAAVDLRGHAVKGLVQLSGDVIDFGDVVVREMASQSIALSNNDGSAKTRVVITAPQGKNADAFRCQSQGPLPMDAAAQLAVQVDFTPPALGNFTAVFRITPCPTCAPRDVSLAGRGVDSLISVDPASMDFGEVLLGAEAAKPFRLTNTSRSKVTLQSLALAGGPDLTVALDNAPLPYTLAPGQTVTGSARFKPRSLGSQNSQATLPASDGGPGLLALKGLGMGPVAQVRPKTLYVGATAVGTTRSSTVTVTNVGLDPHQTAPLSLSGISIVSNDPSWAVTPPSAWVGEPGSSTQIKISFTPTDAGWSPATLVILSNDGLNPRVEIPLLALGRVLPPCTVSVQPSNPTDFGAVPLFHPSTQGFELVNAISDDCIIGDPVLSGGPAFRWPGGIAPSGRTLPPGGRMSVRVEFVPEAARTYTGGVQFYLSNKMKPSLSVGLQGEGDGGCFFLAPGAVDFGGSAQGCTSPDQIAYAVNHCAGPVTVTEIHTSGPPFALASNAPAVPFTVQSNGNVPIPVSYRPPSIGDDVGSLSAIASTRATPYQVGLTGGVLPASAIHDQWDQSTPKVDLLMVIDNSGSMTSMQRALQSNLDHLWKRIAIANADFHIAITTSGMNAYTQGWTQCPGGASGGEAGRFFPVDNSRPRLLTPETANVRDALFANTNVGLCHWDERFLEPAVAALTDPLISSTKAPGTSYPSDGNAGFLRDDARLALLVVTDTDDDVKLPYPVPVSTYVNKLIAVKHGAKDLISFAALVPLQPCAAAESYPTPRFTEAAQLLGGHLYDSCNLNDFGNMLENALGSLLLPLTSFPLSTQPRDPNTIQVTVNGSAVSGSRYDPSSNRIVFPTSAVPAPGSHITADYQAACR